MVIHLIFFLPAQAFHIVPFRDLCFFIYINDLHYAIKHCKVHHFIDDIKLEFNHSIKKIKKQVNYDLKNLNNWLNAQIISLKGSKTEMVLFKSRKKHKF